MKEGAVHILGKFCPKSDPDIAHMEYSIKPLKLINLYKPGLNFCGLNFYAEWEEEEEPETCTNLKKAEFRSLNFFMLNEKKKKKNQKLVQTLKGPPFGEGPK